MNRRDAAAIGTTLKKYKTTGDHSQGVGDMSHSKFGAICGVPGAHETEARSGHREAIHPLHDVQRSAGNAAAAIMVQRQFGPKWHESDAALAARNLEAIKSLHAQWRPELLKPSPDEDLRQAVAHIRHSVMDWVSADYRKWTPPDPGADAHPQVRADALQDAQTSLARSLEPMLAVLASGDPQWRYEHFNVDVAADVFAVVRLLSVQRGLDQIGHRGAAEKEARATAQLPEKAWCGAFAYTQHALAGGMDSRWRADMLGEGGIRGALAYSANPWVWNGADWVSLKEFHVSRGMRKYTEVPAHDPLSALTAFGVKAGDIVLVDNSFGTNPDHITMAVSFDGRNLVTMGGNQGAAEAGVSKGKPRDIAANPAPNDVTAPVADWDTDPATGKPVKTAIKGMPKNERVHGVGRWSAADYEVHIYRLGSKPTDVPTAAEVSALGNR